LARAGQAVVQFAKGVYSDDEYAIKFFVRADIFEAERSLYHNATFSDLLPNVDGFYSNEDLGTGGHALPACIVMEKGESLDEWSRRRRPDLYAAMPVRHMFWTTVAVPKEGQVMRNATAFRYPCIHLISVVGCPEFRNFTLGLALRLVFGLL
jgi:hypothetical protein